MFENHVQEVYNKLDLKDFLLQEYHLQNALDAQRRLGSAKIRAVPIPNLYEDPDSQSIYPANVELPKQLIRLQRILNRVCFFPRRNHFDFLSFTTRI